MRFLANGDVLLTKPIPYLEGYEQDKSEKCLYHPVWIPCKHRTILTVIMPCNKTRTTPHCQLKDREVNQMYCNTCEVEPKV